MLDLHVLEPGFVKVQGVWIEDDHGVVITADRIWFLDRDPPNAIGLDGAGGRETILFSFSENLDRSMFKL